MVVSVDIQLDFDDNRMHRNTMRPAPNMAVIVAKPPKPPCWRDFVSNSLVADSEFTDISRIARSSNESFSSDGHTNKVAVKTKKVRARIHRTRSQFAIEESDLPAETLTMTLAETKPDDIGLCREASFNERIFQDDNNRKCQSWLQNVEASKPLEDVCCYDLSGLEGEAVSIEIPDDTQCYDQVEECQKNHSNINSVHLKDTHTLPAYEKIPFTYKENELDNLNSLTHSSFFKDHTFINTG